MTRPLHRLVTKLRTNPAGARDLVQTAELACFDARCGDHAYAEAAFDHLFTPERRYLLVTAIKVLREVVGDQLADALGEFDDLVFRRAAPAVPDRSILQTDRGAPACTRGAVHRIAVIPHAHEGLRVNSIGARAEPPRNTTASGDTVMTDVVRFQSPLGPLGTLADRMVLTHYMPYLLRQRNAWLKATLEAGT